VIVDWVKVKAIEYVWALIVGPLAAVIVQGLKAYVIWVESLSAWRKRAFVVVTVTVLTLLGGVTGVDFGLKGDDLSVLANIDAEAIKIVLGSVFAMGLHAVKKQLGK